MSGGINTHWLMHYRVVALVNQCRRLIRDEFGVRLSLTDPDLRQALGDYARRSGSDELKRLMTRIDEEAEEAAPETPAVADKAPARRMYRGQPLPEPAPRPTEEQRAESGREVIYRGRRVRG